MLCVIDFDVSERSDRLRRAFQESRYAAEGKSARAAAKLFGWSENSFKANLNGNSPFGYEQAKRYAEKFRVSAQWLYDGTGPMRELARPARQPMEIPVCDWKDAAHVDDVAKIEGELQTLVAGNLPAGVYFATSILGDAADRVAPEGAYIVINAADRNPRDGKFYLWAHRGEPMMMRYRSRPVRRLEPFSTNPRHEPVFIGERGWRCVGRVVRSVIDLG